MARRKHKDNAAAFNPEDTFVFNEGLTDHLKLEGGDKSVTLNGSARIDSMKVNGDGGVFEATLNGSARISYLSVSSSDLDLVMNDSARVRILQYYDGDANITTGSGYISLIETWQSTNVLKTGSGSIGTIDMGSDTGEFTHKITTNGWVGTIRVASDAVVLKIGDRGVGTISLGDNKDVVTSGSAGIGYLNTGGGNDKITTGGRVDNLNAGEGNDTITTNGSVGNLNAGGGNDRITTNGTVDYLNSGEGNDKITTGGIVYFIDARGGNDSIKLFSEHGFDRVIRVDGGGGTDLLDLSKAKKGVELTLEYRLQDIETVGRLFLTGIDDLKGSKYADDLTGNYAENKLIGGKGNDRLEGQGSDDFLNGGGGKDTFVFGHNGGTDRVKGYSKKQDTIEISSHDGGFKSLKITESGNNKVIEYDNGTIILLGHDDTVLTASQFDFV